jgi:hypothetical protein
MNEQIVEAVLNEVLDELRQANASLKLLKNEIRELETQIRSVGEKEIKVEAPDLGPVEAQIRAIWTETVSEIDKYLQGVWKQAAGDKELLRDEIHKGLVKVREVLEAEPKPIVHEISLFRMKEGHQASTKEPSMLGDFLLMLLFWVIAVLFFWWLFRQIFPAT